MTDDLFPLHDETSAPAASQDALAATRADFGMIPNLERTMASAPALLQAYTAGWASFGATSLTPIEQQVVYQTASFENECDYCVPWHSLLSKNAGMPAVDIAALREGTPLSSPRLESLRTFTRLLIVNRGKIGPQDLAAFVASGFTSQQALEVVLGIAIKVMSNYTNSLAGTPLDSAVQSYEWQKPRIPMRRLPSRT